MNTQAVLAANVQALIDASGMNENSFAVHYKLPKSTLRKMRLPHMATAYTMRLQAMALAKAICKQKTQQNKLARLREVRPRRQGSARR